MLSSRKIEIYFYMITLFCAFSVHKGSRYICNILMFILAFLSPSFEVLSLFHKEIYKTRCRDIWRTRHILVHVFKIIDPSLGQTMTVAQNNEPSLNYLSINCVRTNGPTLCPIVWLPYAPEYVDKTSQRGTWLCLCMQMPNLWPLGRSLWDTLTLGYLYKVYFSPYQFAAVDQLLMVETISHYCFISIMLKTQEKDVKIVEFDSRKLLGTLLLTSL